MIDLGLERSVPDGRPARHTHGLPLKSRWLAPALAVALAALTLAGSVPVRQGLDRLATLPADVYTQFALSGDSVYAIALRQPVYADLISFAATGGRQRWAARLPFSAGDATIDVRPGVVLVAGEDPSGGPAADATVAYDAATGHELWRSALQPGPQLSAPGLATLIQYPSETTETGAPTSQASGPPDRGLLLEVVNPRTGVAIWRRQLGQGWAVNAAGDASAPRLVLVSSAGDAETVDPATGVTLARGRLPPAAQPFSTGQPTLPDVWVAGNLIVVAAEAPVGRLIAAYRADTLAALWQAPIASTDAFVGSCGPMLCLSEPDGVTVLDPATGKTRWQDSAVAVPAEVGGWLYLGRLDGAMADGELRDPVSGRRVADIPLWTPVSLASGGPYLFSRLGQQGEHWLGTLDGDAVTPLGVISDLSDRGCDVGGSRAVCQLVDGRLLVLALRP